MSGKAPVSLPQEKFIWGLHSVVSEIKQVKILQWMAPFCIVRCGAINLRC
jgi:hypothetical protein